MADTERKIENWQRKLNVGFRIVAGIIHGGPNAVKKYNLLQAVANSNRGDSSKRAQEYLDAVSFWLDEKHHGL